MANPSVTYSFTNGVTSDATQVNTNFTDLINAMTDGTRDFTIGTLVVNGAVTLKGAVNLGDATADDITIVGSIAASIPFKTNATYNIGTATLAPLSIYLGNGTKSTRLLAGTVGTSYTVTLPDNVPTITGQTAIFDTNATMSFRYPDKFTASKTAGYTATGDETIIPCAPAASMTITLPAASTMTGKSLTIIKTDTDLTKTVTIDGNASETINGALTYVLYTQYESVTIKCDGSNWFIEQHFCSTPWANLGAITIGATTTPPTKASGIAVDKLWWRRVGSCAEFRYEYRQTNATSAATGTGDYLFPITAIGTIDTAQVTAYATVEGSGALDNNNCVGVIFTSSSGTNSDNGTVSVYDASNVRFLVTGGAISSGFRAVTGATMGYQAFFTLPMTGWNA